MKYKILAGITHEDELYFLEVDTDNDKRNGYNEFTMTGFTVRPVRLEDAHIQVRESLEDGDLWRQAVECESTELGLNEWVDYVIDTDGNLSGFDNSLFDSFVTIDNEEWCFESSCCGQHQEKELKHYFIDRGLFTVLHEAWDKYHLTDVTNNPLLVNHRAETLDWWLDNKREKQNFEGLAMQAITIINQ